MDPSYNAFDVNGTQTSIVSAPTNTKKYRLFWLVGGVTAVLIIIALALFFTIGSGNGNNNTTSLEEVKPFYNSYVNYILLGKDDQSEVSLEDIENTIPYFFELTQSQKNEYIKQVNAKYDKLVSKYYELSDELDLWPLKTFFSDYVSIPNFTTSELIKQYDTEGEQIVNEKIESMYNMSEIDSYLDTYLQKRKSLELENLKIIAAMKAAGCINGEQIIDNCYTMTEETKSTLDQIVSDLNDDLIIMEERAYSVLERLYINIYNIRYNYEASVEE